MSTPNEVKWAYHVTLTSNLEGILMLGLVPSLLWERIWFTDKAEGYPALGPQALLRFPWPRNSKLDNTVDDINEFYCVKRIHSSKIQVETTEGWVDLSMTNSKTKYKNMPYKQYDPR